MIARSAAVVVLGEFEAEDGPSYGYAVL